MSLLQFARDWWWSMGRWRWANLVPVVIGLALAVRYEAMPLGWIDQGQRALSGNEIRLQTRGTVRAGESLPVRVLGAAPGAYRIGFEGQALQTVELTASSEDAEWNASATARLPVPGRLQERLSIIMMDGDEQAEWPAGRLLF